MVGGVTRGFYGLFFFYCCYLMVAPDVHNLLRFARDNRMRLIDLDASARIAHGSSSSPQCQRTDVSAQSVTAPAAGQSDAAAPWRADSDNLLRCGTLRMSSRSAEGEKKWFVLRRGLEPFYPPQLEIFDFFADEPEPPTAVVPRAWVGVTASSTATRTQRRSSPWPRMRFKPT